MDELNRQIFEILKNIESRLASLEAANDRLAKAYSKARTARRRPWVRPPIWTFEQHSPRPLKFSTPSDVNILPANAPRIGIVTPTYNYARYLGATIDSVLEQNYPNLVYHVQDAASTDGTVALLKTYGNRLSWRSEPDNGQAHAINLGFAGNDCEIMGYLNSDDVLLPGTLAYVANAFQKRPDLDIVYGHRVFIDRDGLEIGRAVLPAHDPKALRFAGYIPQETMFWRRRVWEKVGPLDESFQFALDWDFLLRAQEAGFKLDRLPRFLACFRVHDSQKTSSEYDIGYAEMQRLRRRHLGFAPSQREIYRALRPYLIKQLLFHLSFRLGLLRI